jgi:hypothetical protein
MTTREGFIAFRCGGKFIFYTIMHGSHHTSEIFGLLGGELDDFGLLGYDAVLG